jgi:hypothetical protein
MVMIYPTALSNLCIQYGKTPTDLPVCWLRDCKTWHVTLKKNTHYNFFKNIIKYLVLSNG